MSKMHAYSLHHGSLGHRRWCILTHVWVCWQKKLVLTLTQECGRQHWCQRLPDHSLCILHACSVAHSWLTLVPWTVCSSLGSFVRGIHEAWILEWVAISYSRGSPNSGIEPASPALTGGFFYHWATWESHFVSSLSANKEFIAPLCSDYSNYMGSIPGQGIKIPQARQHSQNEKKNGKVSLCS